MKVGLVHKLLSVLNKVLDKFGLYDECTMMGGSLGMLESTFFELILISKQNVLPQNWPKTG